MPPSSPVQRQAEEDESERPSTATSDDELYEPVGAERRKPENEPTQLSLEGGASSVVQRDAPSPPPPPVVFPHFTEWYPGIADAAAQAWAFTCKDRLERGFHVLWNERTNRSFADNVTEGTDRAIEIPGHDRDPVFTVGWFHTHPRPKPGFVQVAVGPSEKDKKTSDDTKLPGAVRDFLAPGVTDCAKSGTYFFGPDRRPPLAR